ncbi:MAG: outer membrane beta-barrel protein [Pedobacter sp.]|jgi:hypothetical protein
MKKTEDQVIADKIREVFDNFDDPAADQGWQELRKKYPEPDRKPLLFWFSSAAAILILTSLFFLYQYDPKQETTFADSNHSSTPKSNDHLKSKELPLNNQVPDTAFSEKTITNIKYSPSAIIKNQTPGVNQNIISTGNLLTEVKKTVIEGNTKENKPILSNLLDPDHNRQEKSDTIVLAQNNIAEAKPQIKPDNIELKDTKVKGSKSPKNRDKSIVLGLYAGSFINYAEGSESNINLGAGFSSDFRINNRLKLSTGINLSKNSLTYNEDTPSNAYGSFQPSSAFAASTLVSVNNYQAELLNLDIPINLKYSFSPGKNSAYILAGLSSGTYLNEQYAINFNNFNSLIGAALAQDEKVISKKFNHFDLMKTFNLSFGFNTKIGKNQSIGIEPFIKYPLGGLGSENLKFGASGINIKMNFNTAKK